MDNSEIHCQLETCLADLERMHREVSGIYDEIRSVTLRVAALRDFFGEECRKNES